MRRKGPCPHPNLFLSAQHVAQVPQQGHVGIAIIAEIYSIHSELHDLVRLAVLANIRRATPSWKFRFGGRNTLLSQVSAVRQRRREVDLCRRHIDSSVELEGDIHLSFRHRGLRIDG
jgi:hypothetical protein